MPADCHIVADLDLIVDFGAFANHGVAQAPAIDGRSGPDLDVILDQHPSGLRHFQMPVRPKEDETITVLADAAARMDQDIVAEQRALDRGPGADVAIPADPDVGPNDRTRSNHCSGPDLDVGTNHRQWIDDHAILQMRTGIDDGRRCDPGIAEPGLGA